MTLSPRRKPFKNIWTRWFLLSHKLRNSMRLRTVVFVVLLPTCWLRWQRILLQCRRPRFDPWVRKIPWRREWLPTAVFLPGEFYGWRSLVGCSPWGHKQSDMTEGLMLSLSSMMTSFWFSCTCLWLLWQSLKLPEATTDSLGIEQSKGRPSEMDPGGSI